MKDDVKPEKGRRDGGWWPLSQCLSQLLTEVEDIQDVLCAFVLAV